MSTKEQLLTQAIDAANDLRDNIENYTDTLNERVNSEITEINSVKDEFISSLTNLRDNLGASIPVGPNFMYDTAYFDLYCEAKKGVWYDYCNSEQRPNFLSISQLSSRHIDMERSSLKAKVVLPMNDKIVDSEYNIPINGRLADLVTPGVNFDKGVLMFDIEIYRPFDSGSALTYFYPHNPGCENKLPAHGTFVKNINPDWYFSAFFNIVDIMDNTEITDGSGAEFHLLTNGGARHKTVVINKRGIYVKHTPKDGQPTNITLDRSKHLNQWMHASSELGDDSTYGCAYFSAIHMYGNYWIDHPLKLTVAVTLPYLGFGRFNHKPVWVSEAAALSDASSTIRYRYGDRYPYGIRYPTGV